MDVINKEKKWKRKRNDGTAKGIVVINTLCKHDDVEEDNKSKSSTNKNKRKMNDVWKAIQYAVAKVKNNKRRKMSDFSEEEEEEDMSQKTSTTKNKRKRNDAGEEILFSIVKRKRNDVYKAIRYVVNRKRRRKMLNFMPGMSKHQKSSSNTKRKRNDVILPNNKRNYLGKTKEDDDKEHNTSNSIIGDPVYLSDLLFTKKQEILSMKSSTTKNKRKWNHAGEEEILPNNKRNNFGKEKTKQEKDEDEEQQNTTPIVMKHQNNDAGEDILSKNKNNFEKGKRKEEKDEDEEQQNTTPIVMKHEEQQNTNPIVHQNNNAGEDILLKNKRNNFGKGITEEEKDENKEQQNTTAAIVIKHQKNDVGEDIMSKNKRDNFEKGKTKEEKDEEEHNICSTNIKIGDTVNLSDLLFTKKRNFLINYNQQRVEAKDLSGKFVVLYFMSLTPYHDRLGTRTKHLLDIYSKLQPRGDFEIVLVAISDHVSHYFKAFGTTPCQSFFEKFSTMPWPAIPFSDLESRKRLESIFGNDDAMPCSIIIDPRGVVLQCDADPLFLRYGAAAYPFTNERMQSIDSEDNLLLMQQPLTIQKLLATPERDYLINNNGDQVPLDDLDHKVVGLYFCPCINKRDELLTTGKLKKLYQELSENSKEFEIVLIYTHGWCDHRRHEYTCGCMVEDSFLDEIKTMPWLALPFKDTNCNKKLQRLFQHPQELGEPVPARLVIIGPHGKFIEPLGTYIFLRYGAPAYPFSLQSAVNLELEMLKKLKLEMFWDLDTVFTHNNGSQVRFSQYIGKRIIVIFQKSLCISNDFWRELKARYYRMKGTDDEFDVIHISMGVHAKDKRISAPMPWFMHPPLDLGSSARQFRDRVWPGYLKNCGLLAFDRDGSVVRMKKDPELGDNMVFPFYQDGDMENEVLLHVKEYIKRRLECVNRDPDF